MNTLDIVSQYRPLLFSLAYRMLGSVMDAEDIVQEACVRWLQQDAGAAIAAPKAYLTTVVTRLCIDHLRSARVQREEYIGPWLPEPLLTDPAATPADTAALADSLGLAFLVLLERLSPVERAVFLLHEVFGYAYEEIAPIVGKSTVTCRQSAQRGRRHLEAQRSRFTPSPDQHEQLTQRFMQACEGGHMAAILDLLADEVTLWTDGGGKVRAARRPIHGPSAVARFLLGILAKAPPGHAVHLRRVNGQAGIVTVVAGTPLTVTVLEIAAGRITGIRIVVSPEKLRGLSGQSPRDDLANYLPLEEEFHERSTIHDPRGP